MRYTVLWTPTAERDLAELWLQSADREAIRSAADTLDSLLRDDAHLRGESRYDSLRIVHAARLALILMWTRIIGWFGCCACGDTGPDAAGTFTPPQSAVSLESPTLPAGN